jgi:hypothetical protein
VAPELVVRARDVHLLEHRRAELGDDLLLLVLAALEPAADALVRRVGELVEEGRGRVRVEDDLVGPRAVEAPGEPAAAGVAHADAHGLRDVHERRRHAGVEGRERVALGVLEPEDRDRDEAGEDRLLLALAGLLVLLLDRDPARREDVDGLGALLHGPADLLPLPEAARVVRALAPGDEPVADRPLRGGHGREHRPRDHVDGVVARDRGEDLVHGLLDARLGLGRGVGLAGRRREALGAGAADRRVRDRPDRHEDGVLLARAAAAIRFRVGTSHSLKKAYDHAVPRDVTAGVASRHNGEASRSAEASVDAGQSRVARVARVARGSRDASRLEPATARLVAWLVLSYRYGSEEEAPSRAEPAAGGW